MGEEDWVTVCDLPKDDGVTVYCTLVPKESAAKSLNQDDWDVQIGDGIPGIISTNRGGTWETTYYRHGNSEGVEPLVHYREWHGLRESSLELSEEFRHFHNLHEDGTGKFVKIERNGEAREVARLGDRKAIVRVRELKEFLAVKKMSLMLLFDSTFKNADVTPEAVGLRHDEWRNYQGTDFAFRVHVLDAKKAVLNGPGTLSFGRGKKAILGYEQPPEEWGGPTAPKTYENFIIGTQDGKPVEFTCNPEKLGNFFGKNPDAPNYVTPIHFRREVLRKYYDQPEIFSVHDGYLTCGGLWSLRIDNNHEKHVIVLLGDLGRDLPASDRAYWKSFNVPPEGGMSDVAWKRGFEAQFTDPERPDLVFKQRFEAFQKLWVESHKWPLWKPLAPEDRHHYTGLRIPLTETQGEFDGQVLSLTKVLIDSLNENQLANGLALDPNTKGIGKLEGFLKSRGTKGFERRILFLRMLQKLRNGVSHRKGDDYVAGFAHFRVEKKGFMGAFEDILKEAIDLVEFMSSLVPRSSN